MEHAVDDSHAAMMRGDERVSETRLVTMRLVLRAPREEDIAPLHRVMATPDVMRYAATLPHRDMGVTRAWLFKNLDNPAPDETFVIERAGEAIGRIAIGSSEIGFVVAKHCWGEGVGLEACQAFIAHRIAAGDPHILACVDPRNAASLRLLRKLGFLVVERRDRAFEVGGTWVDSLLLRLEAADWVKEWSNGSRDAGSTRP